MGNVRIPQIFSAAHGDIFTQGSKQVLLV